MSLFSMINWLGEFFVFSFLIVAFFPSQHLGLYYTNPLEIMPIIHDVLFWFDWLWHWGFFFCFVLIVKRLNMLHTGWSSLLVAIYWLPTLKNGFLSVSMLRICLVTFKREEKKDEKDKFKKKNQRNGRKSQNKIQRWCSEQNLVRRLEP